MDHIALDHQVVVQELPPVRIIGHYPSHFCSSEEYEVRLFLHEKIIHSSLVPEIQLCGGP